VSDAREHNLALLRDALGTNDWRIAYSTENGHREAIDVVPIDGATATAGLPVGDTVQADFTVGFVGGYGSSPDDAPACGETSDAGVTCSIVHTSDGRPVRVIHSAISYSSGHAFNATHVTFRRPDGSVALLDLTVNAPSNTETASRSGQAATWLNKLDDTAVATATDPGAQNEDRYGPTLAQPTPSRAPTTGGATITDQSARHNRNMERLKTVFGDGWELQYGYKPQPVAGELTLVRGSSAARGLPAGSGAEADIRVAATTLTTLSCPMGGGTGFTCEHQRTAGGMDVLLVRSRLAGSPEPSVQTTAQYLRPNGEVATVDLSVHTPSGTGARGLDQAQTWLNRLDNTLMAAATNPATEVDQAPPHPLPNCAAAAVKLVVGGVAPVAHERHDVLLHLQNTSGAACQVPAMPEVALLDANGDAIPFRYAYSNAVPRGSNTVVEPEGESVFSLSNNTCTPQRQRAVTASVTLPGSSTPLTVALPAELDLSWCAPGDPGSTVTVAPVATAEATPAP
jgi:hypothetical protein